MTSIYLSFFHYNEDLINESKFFCMKCLVLIKLHSDLSLIRLFIKHISHSYLAVTFFQQNDQENTA